MVERIFSNKKVLIGTRVGLLLLAVIMPFVVQSAALATISQPGSTPSISDVHVNRNLITSGDICFYGKYELPYTTPPGTSSAQTFIFRLLDTDNSTEIGAVTPYAYFDNGYNLGIFSLYFEDASTANITWGTNYTIRISENPGQFTAPTYWDFVMPATAYSSVASSQTANQNDMAVQVIALAGDMQQEYDSYTFLEQSASGTILSIPTGATYFRGAIPGLQLMAPSLFLVQSLDIDLTATEWTTAQADNYTGRFSGTWVGTSENATATQFGMTTQMITGLIFIVPACIGAVIMSQKRFKRTEPGLIAAIPLVVMGFVMGWLPAAITASIFQICGIYIAYLFFFSRG